MPWLKPLWPHDYASKSEVPQPAADSTGLSLDGDDSDMPTPGLTLDDDDSDEPKPESTAVKTGLTFDDNVNKPKPESTAVTTYVDRRGSSMKTFPYNRVRPLGNLIRLRPLHPSQLPSHPLLAKLQNAESRSDADGPQVSADKQTEDLEQFITAAIREAWDFNDYTVEGTFKKGSKKRSRPAKGKVRILSHTYTSDDLYDLPWEESAIRRRPPSNYRRDGDVFLEDVEAQVYRENGEAWFARRSRHENVSTEDSAKFCEFENGLLHNHSANEKEYTPDVLDAHMVLNWRDQLLEKGNQVGPFRDVDMAIYEMVHNIPSPLRNRAFPVLVITATIQRNGFIVVQIPVDLREVPEALYSNGRNVRDGTTPKLRKKVVVGMYTSVERVALEADNHICWQMATTSDAKGSLPLRLQRSVIPSKIRKDVGLFIKWRRDVRQHHSG